MSAQIGGSINGTCIVIPALNEERSIGRVVSEVIQTTGLPVVVVNDASDDATATEASKAGAIVLNLCIRLGAWGAAQTGIRYAKYSGCDVVVTMDGDGQHSAVYVKDIVNMVRNSSFNVIVGSDVARGLRRHKFAWWLLRLLSNAPIADITSGFRGYDRHAIELLAGSRATYLEYQDVGVIALLLESGLSIGELDIEINQRAEGSSRIFSSWLKVIGFMFNGLLLGLAKRRR